MAGDSAFLAAPKAPLAAMNSFLERRHAISISSRICLPYALYYRCKICDDEIDNRHNILAHFFYEHSDFFDRMKFCFEVIDLLARQQIDPLPPERRLEIMKTFIHNNIDLLKRCVFRKFGLRLEKNEAMNIIIAYLGEWVHE